MQLKTLVLIYIFVLKYHQILIYFSLNDIFANSDSEQTFFYEENPKIEQKLYFNLNLFQFFLYYEYFDKQILNYEIDVKNDLKKNVYFFRHIDFSLKESNLNIFSFSKKIFNYYKNNSINHFYKFDTKEKTVVNNLNLLFYSNNDEKNNYIFFSYSNSNETCIQFQNNYINTNVKKIRLIIEIDFIENKKNLNLIRNYFNELMAHFSLNIFFKNFNIYFNDSNFQLELNDIIFKQILSEVNFFFCLKKNNELIRTNFIIKENDLIYLPNKTSENNNFLNKENKKKIIMTSKNFKIYNLEQRNKLFSFEFILKIDTFFYLETLKNNNIKIVLDLPYSNCIMNNIFIIKKNKKKKIDVEIDNYQNLCTILINKENFQSFSSSNSLLLFSILKENNPIYLSNLLLIKNNQFNFELKKRKIHLNNFSLETKFEIIDINILKSISVLFSNQNLTENKIFYVRINISDFFLEKFSLISSSNLKIIEYSNRLNFLNIKIIKLKSKEKKGTIKIDNINHFLNREKKTYYEIFLKENNYVFSLTKNIIKISLIKIESISLIFDTNKIEFKFSNNSLLDNIFVYFQFNEKEIIENLNFLKINDYIITNNNYKKSKNILKLKINLLKKENTISFELKKVTIIQNLKIFCFIGRNTEINDNNIFKIYKRVNLSNLIISSSIYQLKEKILINQNLIPNNKIKIFLTNVINFYDKIFQNLLISNKMIYNISFSIIFVIIYLYLNKLHKENLFLIALFVKLFFEIFLFYLSIEIINKLIDQNVRIVLLLLAIFLLTIFNIFYYSLKVFGIFASIKLNVLKSLRINFSLKFVLYFLFQDSFYLLMTIFYSKEINLFYLKCTKNLAQKINKILIIQITMYCFSLFLFLLMLFITSDLYFKCLLLVILSILKFGFFAFFFKYLNKLSSVQDSNMFYFNPKAIDIKYISNKYYQKLTKLINLSNYYNKNLSSFMNDINQ